MSQDQQQFHQPALDPRLGVDSTSTAPATIQPSPYGNDSIAHSPQDACSRHNKARQPYYHTYPTSQARSDPQVSAAAFSSADHNDPASAQLSDDVALREIPDNVRGDSPSEDNSPGQYATERSAEDAKRPRACEACRGLKVRCDQDPAHPEIPCRRCQKAGRQCIITAPSRKRQKKADNRVAELERKLDALTAVLQQQQSAHLPYPASQPSSVPQHPLPSTAPITPAPSSVQPPHKRRRTEDEPREIESLDGTNPVDQGSLPCYAQSEDSIPKQIGQSTESCNFNADSTRHLIHRSPEEFKNRINSLVSPDIGITIFDRYVSKLAPHMPAVVFPAGTTAEQIWIAKPILYVCILSTASIGFLHPAVTKQLAQEAIRAIADCVVCNGAKSLELVQAMQVLALWYKPPERAEQANFYQLIHMAAVMAVDIGLGRRFNPAKARRGFGGPHAEYAPGPQMILPQNSDTVEARRAWLASYYLCASASMVLRRPNLLRWSNYMQESVDVLGSSHEALPSDKIFCQHIKVQHICENIGLQFLMDDNTATISISDPKVSYALNVLDNDLKTWANSIPPELRDNQELKFFEHVASLYLHEIALHFNHNIEDFRMPFTEESLKSVNNSSEVLTQHQMTALEACRRSAHGVLDTMLSLDTETVKSLPMLIYFVRCTYALVVLIKMHVAITTPGSEISKIMTADDVRGDYYIDTLISMFRHVAKMQDFRPHPKILYILSVLRGWFTKHKENVAAQARGEQLPHPPATTQQQQQDVESAQNTPTPLHVLSHIATGGHSQQSQSSQANESPNWTFSSPFPINYTQAPQLGNRWPAYQQRQQHLQAPQPSTYPFLPENNVAYADANEMFAADGQISQDLEWGSGFEQAMGLHLGSVEGVFDSGMDGLFSGGRAPYGLHGDGLGAAGW